MDDDNIETNIVARQRPERFDSTNVPITKSTIARASTTT